MTSRFIPIYFLDGSFKTISVDEEMTCMELASIVCDQIELVQAREDFRFFAMVDHHEHMLNGDDRPLVYLPGVDLARGNPDTGGKLIFKRAFFLDPEGEEITDPVLAEYMYHQAHGYISAGLWPVTVEQAIDLAGILMVCKFGSPKEALPAGFLLPSLHSYVPPHIFKKLKPKVWEAKILEAYRHNSGLTLAEAQQRYFEYARENILAFSTIPYPGMCVRFGDKKMKGKVYIAVGVNGMNIFKADDMSVVNYFPFSQIRSWASNNGQFIVTASQSDADTSGSGIDYVFDSVYGEQLSAILKAYAERLTAAAAESMDEDFQESHGADSSGRDGGFDDGNW